MTRKIEHIGIIVKDLEFSIKKFTSLLGLELKDIEEIKVENSVGRMAFLPVGETNIELIEFMGKNSLTADFDDHRAYIHHIAFKVEDLNTVFGELQSQGVEFVHNKIIQGSRGSKVVFFKPEEFNGVYIELVEKHKDT